MSLLELSDTQVYEPSIRALLATASHFCEVLTRVWGADTPHRVGDADGGAHRDQAHGQALAAADVQGDGALCSLLLSSIQLSDTQVYEP